MRLTALCAVASLGLTRSAAAYGSSSEDEPKPLRPCTIRSTVSGNFFDLNPVSIVKPEEPDEGYGEDTEPLQSWHARGYDFPTNFTINICAGVVEDVDDFEDIDSGLARNVSAYYHLNGRSYALGLQNDELVLRGRKLVLNYTNGSFCDADDSPSRRRGRRAALPDPRENDNDYFSQNIDLEEDYDYDPYPNAKVDNPEKTEIINGFSSLETRRRKSAIISLLCQSDRLLPSSISFVGTTDNCAYFFEMRTAAACSVVETEEQTVGPTGVFSLILLVAFGVYVVGGCFYQRTVMHQRGWRQMPNYSMWAGIVGFIWETISFILNSCMRILPGSRAGGGFGGGFGGGYNRVSTFNSSSHHRSNHPDDENRLIDQLDEEWDD